jgi:8-oxo-dGTP pyrophosphatase MutT (NUDIX family)
VSERWKPNVTVAAIASRRRRATSAPILEYLLVEEETPMGLRLNNPAGHLDAGESPADAVVRETREETTRTFVPAAVVGLYLTRADRSAGATDVTYLRIAFAGRVGAANPRLALDAGIVRTLWMTLDELRAARRRHRSSLVLRSVEDAAAGRGWPLASIFTDPSVYASTPTTRRAR